MTHSAILRTERPYYIELIFFLFRMMIGRALRLRTALGEGPCLGVVGVMVAELENEHKLPGCEYRLGAGAPLELYGLSPASQLYPAVPNRWQFFRARRLL